MIVTAVLFAVPDCMRAQNRSDSANTDVRVFVDGVQARERLRFPFENRGAAGDVADAVLNQLRRRGYLYARLDSVVSQGGTAVYVTAGGRVVVGRIHLATGDAGLESPVDSPFSQEPGQPLDVERLEGEIRSTLDGLAEEGRHMATIAVDSLVPAPGNSLAYDVFLSLRAGPPVPAGGLLLQGALRTNPTYAARTAGIRAGGIMPLSQLQSVTARLRDSGNFLSVGPAELLVYSDTTSMVHVVVEEAPPGSFDLVLGYLPGLEAGAKAQIVGSGHLQLKNPFGHGRTFALRLDRRPSQTSSVDVTLADPLVAGLPINVEASFSGLQQDSTYNQRRLSAVVGYRLTSGVELAARYAREATRPGSAGVRLQQSDQRVARADGSYWGIRARLSRVDNVFNPRTGLALESTLERGDKTRRGKTVTPEGDTTSVSRTIRQERLGMTARVYVGTFDRQTVLVGADAYILLSDIVDESDLFRFGGANSLRGYDEDFFRAKTAVRLLSEYRFLLEGRSFVFVFVDVGYIETPPLADFSAGRSWYPGFGLGMQFETAVGIMKATYALNDRDGIANGRVHLGVSFGL